MKGSRTSSLRAGHILFKNQRTRLRMTFGKWGERGKGRTAGIELATVTGKKGNVRRFHLSVLQLPCWIRTSVSLLRYPFADKNYVRRSKCRSPCYWDLAGTCRFSVAIGFPFPVSLLVSFLSRYVGVLPPLSPFAA